MRTFIAVPIPEPCRIMLDRMQKNLRAFEADVRWVAIPSIHLTLKFLGEADPAVIPGLSNALRRASASQGPFSLRLHGLGCFPGERSPRVIWCGIEGETEALIRLQTTVEAVCAEFGFAPEERAFRPHLTLGRVRGKRNLQPLLDCIKMGSDMESGFKADRYNVYQSVLKPQGAVYTVLQSIALVG
jgi:2'-5' RNA ligase